MLALSFVTLALSAGLVTAAAVRSALTPVAELYSPLVAQKVLQSAQAYPNPAKYPQYTDRVEGDWIWFVPNTWTSGFFPSTMYAMYERAKLCPSAGDPDQWLALGRAMATGEIPLELNNTQGHDVGFLSFPFSDELTVNPNNQTAIQAINQFAADLAARFNPIVGCTRSWDTADPTDFQVIIDNMMNLEVFFASEALTGNHTLREMAISHATKTMINHIRPDGGSFHVVEYNATTGAVIDRITSQGYANWSTWSRGESWGIYGFANMFKHTKIPDFLETSRRMAKYFISHIPDDGIVPWDFNAPLDPPRPADTSAAMISANGLLLLADQEKSIGNLTGSAYYIKAAIKIVNDNTKLAWAPSWQSLLSNGTVNNPEGNNLTGIVYGDYYFIEAGNQFISRGLATCS